MLRRRARSIFLIKPNQNFCTKYVINKYASSWILHWHPEPIPTFDYHIPQVSIWSSTLFQMIILSSVRKIASGVIFSKCSQCIELFDSTLTTFTSFTTSTVQPNIMQYYHWKPPNLNIALPHISSLYLKFDMISNVHIIYEKDCQWSNVQQM